VQAREVGMDGTMGKPCRPETLRNTLKDIHAGSWKRGTFSNN
jgi:hypothetical protein